MQIFLDMCMQLYMLIYLWIKNKKNQWINEFQFVWNLIFK